MDDFLLIPAIHRAIYSIHMLLGQEILFKAI